MVALLLILIPLAGGLLGFLLRDEKTAKMSALLFSLAALGVMVWGLAGANAAGGNQWVADWLPQLGSRFALQMDGASAVLCLLTVLAYPLILLGTWNNHPASPANYFALLLLAQAGILGVFLAADGLLFYFFWELALIPVYFLCSRWGGEKRIAATFKFFIYTFLGSLLLLVGLLYLYYRNPEGSFALESLYRVQLSTAEQGWMFWLFFVAFAIKMPVFPFHTWQPDTYEQAPAGVTMVLSALMVKMGLFAVIRWLIPLFPEATAQFDNVVIGLSVVGMIYASLLAMQQDDIKRLIAYSSIAHIGLMSAALFANNESALQGALIQFFSHGVNVLGMWIVVDLIEQRMGTRNMRELGGLAQQAPGLAILLVIVALANVALPLTNAFIGEFLMFNGLFQFNVWYAAVAGLSIILSAVYTLRMIQKVFFGEVNERTAKMPAIRWYEQLSLVVIVGAVFVLGVYPAPVFALVGDTVTMLLAVFN
ncbi:MAG TPA: NADH-quinone oxidoreductase subunit M [Lacibacter sp.]|nr:NADH-quinone oxidoreductase subunit M [Lacibacter sp.]HMO88903.1 NADH-quinone oxidoreductase subunit M [Lacibacter sp.]HMP86823.1 NADH-quinone oxidoreductase subunit M [Lacibacter sp.]